MELGRCKECSAVVLEWPKSYACSNYLTYGCKFVLDKKQKGFADIITKEKFEKLLNDEIVEMKLINNEIVKCKLEKDHSNKWGLTIVSF